MRPKPLALLPLLLCALTLRAAPAQSQDREATPAEVFRVGAEAFEVGNYRVALASFERVFALRGNPALLFNIYRCHRAMGDAERAAHALRRFLLARPDTPERAALEADLARLDAATRALAQRAAVTPPPARPPPHPTRGPGVGPWITLGLGVAAAGVGAGLMIAAGSTQADAANAQGERARSERLDSASTQHTAGIALVGVGAAAVVGGALWAILAPRGPTLDVAVGPQRAALSLSVRWP